MTARLPGARAQLADAGGITTPAFYRFFAALQDLQSGGAIDVSALQAEVDALQAQVNGLPSAQYPTLQAQWPIVSQGLLQNGFANLVWQGTTDDVPEGSRLYFTTARAYTAAKAALVAGPNVTITANDGAMTLTIAAAGSAQTFNLITDDGDAFMTDDYADLMVA